MEIKLTAHEKSELMALLPYIDEGAFSMGVRAIWTQIDDCLDMEKRKAMFLYVLEILFDMGKVFWGVEGVIENDIKRVVRDFETNWPDEECFDDDRFNTVLPYHENGQLMTHEWIVGDLVWKDDDGDLLWSSDSTSLEHVLTVGRAE